MKNVYDDFFKPKKTTEKGGQGSGNWGHQGLDGVWGGSSPTKGGSSGGAGGADEEGLSKIVNREPTPRPEPKPGETGNEYAQRWFEQSKRTGSINVDYILDKVGKDVQDAGEGVSGLLHLALGQSLAQESGWDIPTLLQNAYGAFEAANMHSLNDRLDKKFTDDMPQYDSDTPAHKRGVEVAYYFEWGIQPIGYTYYNAFVNAGRKDIADVILDSMVRLRSN